MTYPFAPSVSSQGMAATSWYKDTWKIGCCANLSFFFRDGIKWRRVGSYHAIPRATNSLAEKFIVLVSYTMSFDNTKRWPCNKKKLWNKKLVRCIGEHAFVISAKRYYPVFKCKCYFLKLYCSQMASHIVTGKVASCSKFADILYTLNFMFVSILFIIFFWF